MQHKTRDILLGGLLVVLALTLKVQGQQFERAINALDRAIANRDAISLPLYIEGCRGLQGFGKLFAFCDGQFGNMVDNLEQAGLAVNGERLPAYNSIQSAIEFEIEHGLVRSEKPSAARGVADLQWALRWLSNFMQKLSVMGDKGDTASAAKKAYSEVFGKKHAWMIKTVVGFGLRTLPKKKILIQRIFSDEDSSAEQRNEKIAKFARITEELISVLDKFYAEKNLHRM